MVVGLIPFDANIYITTDMFVLRFFVAKIFTEQSKLCVINNSRLIFIRSSCVITRSRNI